jgi:hypothetical protein
LTAFEYYDIVLHMTDREMVRALERGEPTERGFDHADHLRAAWVYLDESGGSADAAVARMAATLQRVAAAAGKPATYSGALTAFWIYQLAAARVLMPAADVEALFRACPRLLDKDLVLAYYSADVPAPGPADPPRHA